MLAILRVVAVLLILIGVIWVGQGLGYIHGSFMTGQPFWAWVGAVCLVAGAGLATWSFRRRNQPRV